MSSLDRSLDSGVHSNTVQFSTMRNNRTFFSNYVHTTPEGANMTTLTDGKRSMFISGSPTYSNWYKRFMTGCHARMGDVVMQDQAITIDELLAITDLLEKQWMELSHQHKSAQELFEVATLGTAMTSGYSAALRGEELGFIRLGETRVFSSRGLQHKRKPHIML